MREGAVGEDFGFRADVAFFAGCEVGVVGGGCEETLRVVLLVFEFSAEQNRGWGGILLLSDACSARYGA